MAVNITDFGQIAQIYLQNIYKIFYLHNQIILEFIMYFFIYEVYLEDLLQLNSID